MNKYFFQDNIQAITFLSLLPSSSLITLAAKNRTPVCKLARFNISFAISAHYLDCLQSVLGFAEIKEILHFMRIEISSPSKREIFVHKLRHAREPQGV